MYTSGPSSGLSIAWSSSDRSPGDDGGVKNSLSLVSRHNIAKINYYVAKPCFEDYQKEIVLVNQDKIGLNTKNLSGCRSSFDTKP